MLLTLSGRKHHVHVLLLVLLQPLPVPLPLSQRRHLWGVPKVSAMATAKGQVVHSTSAVVGSEATWVHQKQSFRHFPLSLGTPQNPVSVVVEDDDLCQGL